MKSLLDPNGDYSKSEENVRKFLRDLPDKELKAFYENIELTSFPLLLAKEYHNRFSKRSKKVKTNGQRFRKRSTT